MPPELAVYGPIITIEGSTRVIRYTVETNFSILDEPSGSIAYTANGTGTYGANGDIDAKKQTATALILQYGTQATSKSAKLFKEVPESESIKSGESYGLTANSSDRFIIVPLDTEVIKKQLKTVIPSTGTPPVYAPLIWIEDNKGGIGVEKTDGWGAGTYVSQSADIRIGGLSKGGSISSDDKPYASTVDNFDGGAFDKNQPSSLATVLLYDNESKINFYKAGGDATGGLISISAESEVGVAGSLEVNDTTAQKWMQDTKNHPPAVSVIYKWKEK